MKIQHIFEIRPCQIAIRQNICNYMLAFLTNVYTFLLALQLILEINYLWLYLYLSI
jgi:hypothetical protein